MTRKVWEHLTHYYKVNAWLPRNYVIVNKGVWGGLDGATRTAIQKAADETGAACAAKSAELANWYFEQLEANGMKVEDAGPAFLKELQTCLLYTSPSPRDTRRSRMPSSA